MSLPENITDRLAFFEGFATNEIFVPSETEDGDAITPKTFETSEGVFALGFETEEAMADFTGGGHYAALPGRVIAALLADAGIGLALDPEGAPILLPPDDLRWLTVALTQPPQVIDISLARVIGPAEPPANLVEFLQKRINPARDLLDVLILAKIDTGTGVTPCVVLIGTKAARRPDLASSMQEALTFADAGPDWVIAFAPNSGRLATELRDAGQVLTPEVAAEPKTAVITPPGSDPDKPPRLR